jgi:hypothetical protein
VKSFKKNALAAVGFMASLLPLVAHACPMCFSGNNQNQQAFLYGSLLLMFVPVTALGSLAYWAYRRVRAQDATRDEPPAAELPSAQASVLRVVPPR